ncbi:MAG: nucleotidyltransferase family protein [Deltaproteobacteria bacterium]|nr:nucleotidyltransferase family protein [Deltaproteobacteria bacterium]
MRSKEEGFFWPTREQELLLKATLLKGEQAIVAWKSWAAAINFDQLDTGSQRLLPLLYRNLVNNNVQHPAINVYKGFCRMTWYKNSLIRHRITSVLRLLDAHNIPALLLKGAALVPLYYKDWALRPMNDFDLYVSKKDAFKAFNLLCQSGWKPVESMIDELDLLNRHSGTLIDASGIEFDLHWQVMHQSGQDNDISFIKSTEKMDFGGTSVSVLSHTDQLFHVLIHGARWNEVAPLRWVPDSMMILKAAGPLIDWKRLVNNGRAMCLIVPLIKTLLYLHEVFAAPIPETVIYNLKHLKPSFTERLEFLTNSKPRSILRDTSYLWFTHVRSSGAQSRVALVLGIPSFLRRFWKVPSENNLAVFLIRRLAKRIQQAKEKRLITQNNL